MEYRALTGLPRHRENREFGSLFFQTGKTQWICHKLLTSGIPGGLQISLHIWSPGLQDYSEVWNLKFFRLGGGVFWNSRIWTLTIFIGGVFWNSRIWTLTIFTWGGILKLGFGLSDNFHLGGSILYWTWTLWQFSFWGGILYFRIGVFSLNLDQNVNHSSRFMHHR